MIIQGDCLEVLKTLEDNSVDAICTDPPSGIAFMGKEWDKDKGGRDQWVQWLSGIMTEALRCLKPGGHAFVWALPKTSHWTAYALENSGWEIREKCYHLFGSGMPKGHDVSKAIDRMKGAEREKVGYGLHVARRHSRPFGQGSTQDESVDTREITAPATPEAQQWQGWNTALKPAAEEWILCRKPLSEHSIAANVLRWGTGAINVDSTRVGTHDDLNGGAYSASPRDDGKSTNSVYGLYNRLPGNYKQPSGRWPSNILLSHTLMCQPNGTKRVKVNDKAHDRHNSKSIFNQDNECVTTGYADSEGLEEVEAWLCADGCPVAELDRQSGIRKSGARVHTMEEAFNWHGMPNDTGRAKESSYQSSEGGASRFFMCFPPDVPFHYFSKPSRSERNRGCEGLPKQFTATMNDGIGKREHNPDEPNAWNGNNHPTIKSINLMRYLVRMITPPNGIVLDCFAGSGTTALACIEEGFDYILIEKEQEYIDIIKARINHALAEAA